MLHTCMVIHTYMYMYTQTHTQITTISSWALPCKWGSAGGRVPCAVLVACWWPWGDWGGEWTGPTESTLSHWNVMSCVTSMYTAYKKHPHSQNALTALGMEKRICTNKTKQCALGVLLVYWANSNGNDKQKKGQLWWIPYLMLGHILTGHKMAALVVMFLWLAADDLLQRGWEIEWQTAVYI